MHINWKPLSTIYSILDNRRHMSSLFGTTYTTNRPMAATFQNLNSLWWLLIQHALICPLMKPEDQKWQYQNFEPIWKERFLVTNFHHSHFIVKCYPQNFVFKFIAQPRIWSFKLKWTINLPFPLHIKTRTQWALWFYGIANSKLGPLLKTLG